MAFEFYIILAVVLDFVIGDPRWFPHPVRFIGKLCILFENFFRSQIQSVRIAGYLTSVSVLISTLAIVFLLLYISGMYSQALQTGLAVLLIYFSIAIKDLLHHSKKVYNCLVPNENIDEARQAIGQIVGRDTTSLNREGICKACVETIAENLVDGITAPLFWAILFSLFTPITSINGLSLAAIGITFYKVINTLDSMFGYKNERYLEFGRLSARVDDLVNFIPARLTGIAIVIAALLNGLNWRSSFKIYGRDRLNHSSPNAGHPEAAVAGALDIELGGPSIYFGEKVNKPFIGDKIHTVTPKHIQITNKIVVTTSLIFLFILLLFRKIVFVFF